MAVDAGRSAPEQRHRVDDVGVGSDGKRSGDRAAPKIARSLFVGPLALAAARDGD